MAERVGGTALPSLPIFSTTPRSSFSALEEPLIKLGRGRQLGLSDDIGRGELKMTHSGLCGSHELDKRKMKNASANASAAALVACLVQRNPAPSASVLYQVHCSGMIPAPSSFIS
jgi:hypothetical protein